MSTSLPLDFSSSIFIRSDDDKATLLRAVITGWGWKEFQSFGKLKKETQLLDRHVSIPFFSPEGTPYTGGCYLFDIFFPTKYPHTPPQVNFRTTGGGAVRFNPNLYNCGKVKKVASPDLFLFAPSCSCC